MTRARRALRPLMLRLDAIRLRRRRRLNNRHDRWRQSRAVAILGIGLAGGLALAGCSQGASPAPKSVAAGALPGEHGHGISRDPGSGKVNLATHEGLFVLQSDRSWKQVGPTVDLMGFAISGPGTFYASGHPADGSTFRRPLG